MKKVSVIVAAYNAHDTLARCLGSLVNQTLEDIEIIVINDASKDDTWEIMQRCKKQFPDKVVIINGTENRGPGGAKNQGIDAATGEYIGMVDSDDYVASNMFELMYNEAKNKDADIVDCGIYFESTDGAEITTGDNVTGILDAEKRKILIMAGGYLTTKIIKRELFNNPPVRMREHARCLIDNDYIKYMLLRANNIWNVKQVLYRYCDSKGSATKTIDLVPYYESIYGVMESIYKMCHNLPEYESVKEAMEYTMINWYSHGVNRCLYDQIVKYGASDAIITRYFDNCSDDISDMLAKLTALKKRITTIDYRDNDEVIKRIAELDIRIMEECDRRFGG
jgi:glycosyltransferase involved in cell wall biosynthesis